MTTTKTKAELPPHFFIGCEGHLFDTRKPDWAAEPLRPFYRYAFAEINSVSELKATIRNHEYAWPGGYPLYFITSDGAPLCFACAKKEFRSVAWSIRFKVNDGWRIVACDVNWEDNDCQCANCNAKIESAYGGKS